VTGFTWLLIGAVAGFCECGNETVGSIQRGGLLGQATGYHVFQNELSSMLT